MTRESAKYAVKKEEEEDGESVLPGRAFLGRCALVPHVDLAAKCRAYRSLATMRRASTQTDDQTRYTSLDVPPSLTLFRRNVVNMQDVGLDFLRTVYNAEGQTRFKVDAVLCSLKDVPVAETCAFEYGDRHLGEEFRLVSNNGKH